MKYVIITGATSGIGYAFAERFAQEKYGLILVSSSQKRLIQTKEELQLKYDVPIEIYEQDLSIPDGATNLYQRITADPKEITCLINNAGFGLLGETDAIDMKKEERMLTLNMIAPVQLVKLFIKELEKQDKSYILNVASTGAFQPGPYNSTYYASKAFVYNYSRAIRQELKKRGIIVSTLCPGTTGTKFFEKAGTKTPKWAMTPKKVADYAFLKMMQEKDVIIPGFLNRFMRYIPVPIKIKAVALMKERQSVQ